MGGWLRFSLPLLFAAAMWCGQAAADDDREVFDSDKWLPPPPHVVKHIVIANAICAIDVEYPEFGIPGVDEEIAASFLGRDFETLCGRAETTREDDDDPVCFEDSHARFMVYKAASRLLSVFYEGMEQGGCGPPYHVFFSATFDAASGKKLSVEDFFELVPPDKELGLVYYTNVMPRPDGMIFITSGGMVPGLSTFTLEELAKYGPRLEYWR